MAMESQSELNRLCHTEANDLIAHHLVFQASEKLPAHPERYDLQPAFVVVVCLLVLFCFGCGLSHPRAQEELMIQDSDCCTLGVAYTTAQLFEPADTPAAASHFQQPMPCFLIQFGSSVIVFLHVCH